MLRFSIAVILLSSLIAYGCKRTPSDGGSADVGPTSNSKSSLGVTEIAAPKEFKGVPMYDGAMMPKEFQGATMNDSGGSNANVSSFAEFFTDDQVDKVAEWYKAHLPEGVININNAGLAVVQGKTSDGKIVRIQIMRAKEKTAFTIVISDK